MYTKQRFAVRPGSGASCRLCWSVSVPAHTSSPCLRMQAHAGEPQRACRVRVHRFHFKTCWTMSVSTHSHANTHTYKHNYYFIRLMCLVSLIVKGLCVLRETVHCRRMCQVCARTVPSSVTSIYTRNQHRCEAR